MAARFGGDEFAVLLQATDVSGVRRAVERIQHAISVPVQVPGGVTKVTASVGIAFRPAGDATAEELLRNADRAMYGAKSRQRGTWAMHAPGNGPPRAATG